MNDYDPQPQSEFIGSYATQQLVDYHLEKWKEENPHLTFINYEYRPGTL
jgi:hypothetical protein